MKNSLLLLLLLTILFSSCRKEKVNPSTNQARITEEPVKPKPDSVVNDPNKPIGFYTLSAKFIVNLKTKERKTPNCNSSSTYFYFMPGDTVVAFEYTDREEFNTEENIMKSKQYENEKQKYTINGDTIFYKERGRGITKALFYKDKDNNFVLVRPNWNYVKEKGFTCYDAHIMTKGFKPSSSDPCLFDEQYYFL